MHAKLLQSCPTPCDPVDYSLPSSSVCEILQARILDGLPFPSPGNLSDPGIEPASPISPALAGGSLLLVPPGKPKISYYAFIYLILSYCMCDIHQKMIETCKII